MLSFLDEIRTFPVMKRTNCCLPSPLLPLSRFLSPFQYVYNRTIRSRWLQRRPWGVVRRETAPNVVQHGLSIVLVTEGEVA